MKETLIHPPAPKRSEPPRGYTPEQHARRHALERALVQASLARGYAMRDGRIRVATTYALDQHRATLDLIEFEDAYGKGT